MSFQSQLPQIDNIDVNDDHPEHQEQLSSSLQNIGEKKSRDLRDSQPVPISMPAPVTNNSLLLSPCYNSTTKPSFKALYRRSSISDLYKSDHSDLQSNSQNIQNNNRKAVCSPIERVYKEFPFLRKSVGLGTSEADTSFESMSSTQGSLFTLYSSSHWSSQSYRDLGSFVSFATSDRNVTINNSINSQIDVSIKQDKTTDEKKEDTPCKMEKVDESPDLSSVALRGVVSPVNPPRSYMNCHVKRNHFKRLADNNSNYNSDILSDVASLNATLDTSLAVDKGYESSHTPTCFEDTKRRQWESDSDSTVGEDSKCHNAIRAGEVTDTKDTSNNDTNNDDNNNDEKNEGTNFENTIYSCCDSTPYPPSLYGSCRIPHFKESAPSSPMADIYSTENKNDLLHPNIGSSHCGGLHSTNTCRMVSRRGSFKSSSQYHHQSDNISGIIIYESNDDGGSSSIAATSSTNNAVNIPISVASNSLRGNISFSFGSRDVPTDENNNNLLTPLSPDWAQNSTKIGETFNTNAINCTMTGNKRKGSSPYKMRSQMLLSPLLPDRKGVSWILSPVRGTRQWSIYGSPLMSPLESKLGNSTSSLRMESGSMSSQGSWANIPNSGRNDQSHICSFGPRLSESDRITDGNRSSDRRVTDSVIQLNDDILEEMIDEASRANETKQCNFGNFKLAIYPGYILTDCFVSKLNELYLCGNSFSELPNEPFLHMKQIRKIDVSNNFLGSIPVNILLLPMLEVLLCDHNYIQDIPFTEAFQEIENMKLGMSGKGNSSMRDRCTSPLSETCRPFTDTQCAILPSIITVGLEWDDLAAFPTQLVQLCPTLQMLFLTANAKIFSSELPSVIDFLGCRCVPPTNSLDSSDESSVKTEPLHNLLIKADNRPCFVSQVMNEDWKMRLPWITFDWSLIYPVEVYNFIFLGSLRTAQTPLVYEHLNIDYVLSVGRNLNVTLSAGMKHLVLTVDDIPGLNMIPFFDSAFAFINEAKMANKGVLIHCFAGLSRSVTITVAYLMKTLFLTRDEALALVRQSRPAAQPNEGFMKSLLIYENLLSEERNASGSGAIYSSVE